MLAQDRAHRNEGRQRSETIRTPHFSPMRNVSYYYQSGNLGEK